jgi:hypothetical protein
MKGDVTLPKRIKVSGSGYIKLSPDEPSENLSKKETEELVNMAAERIVGLLLQHPVLKNYRHKPRKAPADFRVA